MEQDGLNHGTRILLTLVAPCTQSDQLVCADSYPASVNAVQELRRIGLHFVGPVKTATKKFPMAYLSNLELHERGDWKGVVSRNTDGGVDMLAFVWLDRDRRYFVSSASSLDAGTPYTRICWWQVITGDNADPEHVELTVPQPKAAEFDYLACGQINCHNRCRQAGYSATRKKS